MISGVEDKITEKLNIREVKTSAYTIPTDAPEADGTLSWNSTTLVLTEISAGGAKGIGYTYANEAAALFINKKLQPLLSGKNALDIAGINLLLIKQVRNSGPCGLAMMAVSAIDNALWDLKAKLLELPLCKLLGQVKKEMRIYGSGGFTSYSKGQLQGQFSHWADEGIRHLKMKVGSQPEKDVERIVQARKAVGNSVELMIDGNGAYNEKQALSIAAGAATCNVTWFEEPVSSDNLAGLHFIRQHAPAPIKIAAGEYGYNLPYFKNMLAAGAVDALQADATRCGGITGFLKAGILAEAYSVPFSSHCAPLLHLHAAVSLPSFYIGEYFHDHVRIETMLFEGMPPPQSGCLYPDTSRPGNGFEFKEKDAQKFKI